MLAAAGILIAPALSGVETSRITPTAQPCYNGIIPWMPDLQSCSLPPVQGRIPGSSPGPGAIIACRNHPGCLPYYVNYP